MISNIPKEKLIFFLWEPWPQTMEYYEKFSRVYTWDDTLVDGKKFFRFNYPSLMPMRRKLKEFANKKLCTMITGNWTPARLDMLNFFHQKPIEEFDFYGGVLPKNFNIRRYKGSIAGWHSGPEKISVLSNYRFCVCFENSTEFDGYITEKIFCCFAAGCLPIYYGAPNVEKYIPKTCFIDYRDFKSNEDLYQFIKTMPESIYSQYINDIRKFLVSEQAQQFSPKSFGELLYQAATDSDY